jgi:putative ABC transport system substrate-binding protein
MRRRDALLLFGSAALARLPVAVAQTGSVQRIGWFEEHHFSDPRDWQIVTVAVVPAELPMIAKELVGARPNLIVTNGAPATLAVLAETRTVPVLFYEIADPIGNRVVDNFARPGGNVTGFASYEPSLAGKWLELLKEVDPRIRRAVMLFNPDVAPNRSIPFVNDFRTAAAALGIEPTVVVAREDAREDPSELEMVIVELAREPRGALIILPDRVTWRLRDHIIRLTWRHRVPTIFGNQYAVATGGLMSYGPNFEDLYGHLASYIDRILRGANVGELPVHTPTRHELVLNVRTAKMIGLEVPPALLARADMIID